MKTYDIVLKSFNLKRVDIARQCLSGLFKLTDEQAQNILNQAPVIVLERVLKKEAHVVSKELKNGGIIVKRYPAGQMGKKVSRIVWPSPPSIHVPGTPKVRKIKTTILRVVRKTQPQGPKGTLLGIEFNAGILKMIKFSEERDGLKTDRVVVSQLNELSDEEIVSQIKTIIHEYKMQSEHIIGVLPREYTTARMLDFPSADDTEIENMVRFQAVKMVPFSKEEMIVDFQVLGPSQEGFSHVMVFIVKREIIERYLGIFAKSNLFPTRLTINTSDMCAALDNYFKEI
ncbi:pilus assembly protein PilM, partial [PVC group bacterium]|nr:pilus assembly protein PilM [PVC group bacterium]